MAQADLGKVRLTDSELSEKVIQVNGGVRFGKDADGKPGYVVTDAETGADTVIPFSEGGSGGLPSGTISLAGSVIHAVGGSANYYLSDIFEPVELSKITKIKTLTNIKNWMRNSSYSTSGLVRRLYILLYLIKNDGTNSWNEPICVLDNSSASTISVENREDVIDLEGLKAYYTSLFGVGVRISQYSGGTGNGYYFRSQFGGIGSPYDSCVKYEVE